MKILLFYRNCVVDAEALIVISATPLIEGVNANHTI